MAQITVGRLPQATEQYERAQFDILIRELEQIITQLNFFLIRLKKIMKI